MGGSLALSTMNYADEIVPQEDLELPRTPAPAPRELEMADRLVESLTTRFEPERYHDEYREKILALVERKAAGEEVVAPPAEAPAKVVNLADALAASLAAARRHPEREHAAGHEARERQASRRAPRREAARTAGKRRRKSST
jgi:DNA end-binding protein Ku